MMIAHNSLACQNLGQGVGCEEQDKTWMVVWGSTPQDGQRGQGISSILSR